MTTLLFGVTASSSVERAATQQIDAHDAEVVAAGKVLIEQRAATVRVHRIGEKTARARPFVERDVVDDADPGDARKARRRSMNSR